MWRAGYSRAGTVVAIAAFAFLAPQSARAQDSFQGLGFLPGGTYSLAYGVSGDGSVAIGYGSSSSTPNYEAFRWTSGGMVGLGFLPTTFSTFSFAFSTNADGSVVVGYSSSSASPSNEEAFRWTSSGMAGLGFLTGGTYSVAQGVNADGSVVVGYGNSPSSGAEAFRWTSSGMAGLGFLTGGRTIATRSALVS
jgi:probable HAF family extracellular repeat protein